MKGASFSSFGEIYPKDTGVLLLISTYPGDSYYLLKPS